LGEAAIEFVQEKLSQPFTVLTRMAEAGGRSRIGRVYALVETAEGDLGEQLVRNGLARIYGARITPPGLANSRLELEKLKELEKQAAQEKIGAWGLTSGRLRVRAEKSAVAFSTFALAEKATRARSNPRLLHRLPHRQTRRARSTSIKLRRKSWSRFQGLDRSSPIESLPPGPSKAWMS